MLGNAIYISPVVVFRPELIINLIMHINELLANHDTVLSEIYQAKKNKAEGKINPWPRIKESKDYYIL